jgi:hypothetical protein
VSFGLAGGDAEGLAALAGGRADLLLHSVDIRLYAGAIDDALSCVKSALEAGGVAS